MSKKSAIAQKPKKQKPKTPQNSKKLTFMLGFSLFLFVHLKLLLAIK